MDQAETMREDGLKETTLPLARIKKVMKMDPDVKMISSDAPLLLSKACEIFISEVTSRSWMLAEINKRRTLQRVDVAGAVGQSDQFDFLIDIVPPEYGYSKHKAKKEKSDGDGEHINGAHPILADGEEDDNADAERAMQHGYQDTNGA